MKPSVEDIKYFFHHIQYTVLNSVSHNKKNTCSLFYKCRDAKYDVEFVRKNPGFRGYTRSNCHLLQRQEMFSTLFNCIPVFSMRRPGVPYCTPLELAQIWHPNATTSGRNEPHGHYLFDSKMLIILHVLLTSIISF